MYENIQKTMLVKQEPVSVKRQSIYAFVPYLNLWAFYRIQKLRMALLIGIGLGFAFYPIQIMIIDSINPDVLTNPFELYLDPIFSLYKFGMYVCLSGVFFYFIRRWSKNWNEKLESGIEDSEKTPTTINVVSRWKKPNIYITITSIYLFISTGILGLGTAMAYYDSYLMAITFTIPLIVVSITSAIGAIKLWNRKQIGITFSMISLASLTIILPWSFFLTTGLVLHLDYGFEISASAIMIPIGLSIVMMIFLSIAKKQVFWNKQFSNETNDETK